MRPPRLQGCARNRASSGLRRRSGPQCQQAAVDLVRAQYAITVQIEKKRGIVSLVTPIALKPVLGRARRHDLPDFLGRQDVVDVDRAIGKFTKLNKVFKRGRSALRYLSGLK